MTSVLSRVLLAGLCVFLTAGASAASLSTQVFDRQGQPLANAVVTLKGSGAAPAGTLKADMDQRNQEFVPRVLAVRTGTHVSFPNSDDIRHQVYSFSAPKRFELRLYEKTPSEPVLFDKPGLVVLGCNIHDWMVGYVYVTDDPWFGVTDASGQLRFDQLPPGRYAVTLWHPQSEDMLPVAGGDLEVAAAGLSKRFELAVEVKPEDLPARPAPSAFGDAFHKAAH
ncbi:methylamine utilization protein [Pseudomonas syringae]|nr:methylamine utilization protein [Pseudomonas syringae]MBD8573372.1 methylamine utilization protein [Pseudomonas syringae]MBD8789425.1 methylamine utilization protein [Pseudomonas syringae]MBD8800151.1 methylamine utilization protein [Pseudomonas syringae]MBD8810853.1 methylamine utilization protein [Pseudomonas syringae]